MRRGPVAGLAVLVALVAGLFWWAHVRGEQSRLLEAWWASAPGPGAAGPIEVSVIMRSFGGALEHLPLARPPWTTAPLPVMLSLSGCGWADDTEMLPSEVVTLAASERLADGHFAEIVACEHRDARALALLYRRELTALLAAVHARPWFDARRVLIRGYGDATPIVAAYNGPALARVTVARPCVVPWGAVSTRTPITHLRSATGLQRWTPYLAGPLSACDPPTSPATLAAATRLINPHWLDSHGANSTRYYQALARAYAEPLGMSAVGALP